MVPLIFKYEEYLIIGVLKGFAERTGALCKCARRPEDRESRRGDQRREERDLVASFDGLAQSLGFFRKKRQEKRVAAHPS